MNDFWKENDLDGSQGDLRALGHHQRPRQAQPHPWGVQQVPFIFIKMNILNMFHGRDWTKTTFLVGSTMMYLHISPSWALYLKKIMYYRQLILRFFVCIREEYSSWFVLRHRFLRIRCSRHLHTCSVRCRINHLRKTLVISQQVLQGAFGSVG